jgi:hypothetical protein
MILHCVFLRFRPEIGERDKLVLYAGIAALKPRIPGMLEVQAGPNASPEGLGKGFEDGFVVTFADAGARDRYLADEEHAKVGARIVAATEGGVDGVLVFDLQV